MKLNHYDPGITDPVINHMIINSILLNWIGLNKFINLAKNTKLKDVNWL